MLNVTGRSNKKRIKTRPLDLAFGMIDVLDKSNFGGKTVIGKVIEVGRKKWKIKGKNEWN